MPETTPARRETPRGFAVYDEFTDKYGNRVRVQKSSLATDDCVWVFAHPEGDSAENASPHLTVEMARRLRAALGAFISEHTDADGSEAAEAEELAAAIHEAVHDGCGLGPDDEHRATHTAALRWMNAKAARHA